MPSEAHLNSYGTYKAGTTKLTTWLIETASKAGADLSFLPPGSTKIPVNRFPSLARSIVATRDIKIRIPQNIITVTRNVISLRKQAGDFFARFGRSTRAATEAVRGGHQHFISILEEVVSILQPSTTSVETGATSTVDNAANMFVALSVEEPVSDGTPAAPKSKNSGILHYELETSSVLDYVFAIFSVFKDANDIRGYLVGIWKDYRDGKLDLMAAAVTTDTAFGMMRRSLQEISDTIPGASTYPEMTATLMRYMDGMGGANVEFAEWLFLDSANLLASYADVLEPQVVPALKHGHFGVYEPRKDRSRMSAGEKQQEDLIVLMEWLPEVTKLSRAKASMPVEDELTTGLRKMMDASDMEACPAYAVFGTGIFLDIHHTLREDSIQPFDEMQATGKRVIHILDEYFRFSRSRRISNWPAQNDEVFENIKSYAKDWTQTDSMSKLLSATLRSMNYKAQPFFFLRNHPILCGLITFRLNMMLQHGGINLCSAWGSVIYPAHLYNAARRSAEMEVEWPDMEYVMSLHSPQRILVGAPPTEPQEYLKRFLLALGASASNFARNRRSGGRALIVESKKGPRGLKTTTPVKDIFRNRYESQGVAALTTPNIVAMLSVASRAERTSLTSVDLQSFAREMLVQRQYSSIQLLTAVREGVAAEELHLLFDYFGLHQRGLKMLRTLQTHIHSDLVRYFGEDYIQDETQLPYLIGYIFEVVRGSDRIAQELRAQEAGSLLLRKATGVLERYLQDGENGRKSIMTAKACSTRVVHAYHAGTMDSLVAPQVSS